MFITAIIKLISGSTHERTVSSYTFAIDFSKAHFNITIYIVSLAFAMLTTLTANLIRLEYEYLADDNLTSYEALSYIIICIFSATSFL
jgi:hypothetical protein